MMTALLRGLAFAALLFCAALPALAQEAETCGQSIAVQMYTLRNVASLEERLKIVHDAGIRAVETSGTTNAEAAELKRLLDEHSIGVTSSVVLLSSLRGDLDGLVEFNRSIGSATLVLSWLMEDERPTDAAGWIALGRELGGISEKLRARGMALAYHNHDFELVDFDGRTGLELLFEGAGPGVAAEIDVAWVARGGQDPAALLRKFDGRVFAIHAKDNAPPGQAAEEAGFAAVGQGVLDWNAILPAARAAGAKWYIIEHDLPLDPAATIRAGARYLCEHLPATRDGGS